MTLPKDLLIITASNGHNLQLAEKFKSIAKDLNITTDLIDLTNIELPLFNPRLSTTSDLKTKITNLHTRMNNYKHWIICAPEYNGSIPPILTNAIAWLSVESDNFRDLFNGRPIAIASYSGGGCMSLLISMRIQLSHLGAQVLSRQIISNQSKAPTNDSLKEIVHLLLQLKPLQLQKT